MRDHLTSHEIRQLGDSKRIDIPLRSVVNLRRVAEELRGLAAHLDILSRQRDEPANVLIAASIRVARTQLRMRRIQPPGRRRHKM